MREIIACAALLCGIISINAQPALADNTVIFKNNTLEHVKPYTAPLQLQIVDGRPKVTDCREQNNDQSYQIRIPPLPEAQSSTPIVIGPDGSSNAALQSGAPGSIQINTGGRLPASRFGSNIPMSGPMHPSLPDASTTNRLANKNFAHGTMLNPGVARPSKPHAANAKPTGPAPVAATYGPDSTPGASGFSGSTTVGKVHGLMLQPRTTQH